MENLKFNMLLRRVILVIMAFVMIAGLTACESSDNIESSNKYKVDVEKQTSEFYVNDFANLFSEVDKQIMITNAIELAEEYDGIQVVLTTVNSLNGNEIEEYAYSMYEQYGIGKDSMGILILLSVGDRNVKIETGKTMQAYITDSKSGQLLDKYGMDYFREDKFAEGLKSVQKAVISEIKNVVPIGWNSEKEKEATAITEENEKNSVATNQKEDSGNSNGQSTDVTQNKNGIGVIDMIFAVLFITALVIIGILISAYRKIKASFSEATEKNSQLSNQVEGLRDDVSRTTNQNAQLSKKVENLNIELAQTCSYYKKTTQNMKDQYEQTYNELNERINFINQENIALNKQITETQEFYSRVCKLHPECNFEKEVELMIEAEFRAAVSSLNNEIIVASNMPANKDSIDIFKNVINTYETAKSDIREAVSADIGKVRTLYEESINLRNRAEAMDTAAKVDEKLNAVLNMPANKDNVETFDNALKTYNESSALTQEFVKADIAKVRSLYQESVRLHNAFEKEQQELRDKAEAQKAFDKMNTVFRNNPNGLYNEYDNLYKGYSLYKSLTNAQKVFFPNMDMLRRYESLMKKAEAAKQNYDVARQAEEDAQSAISSIYGSADEDDRDKISKAFRYYNNLSTAQKEYFSSELLSKMEILKRQADDDHNYQERKRRERRDSSYSSSYPRRSSGGFSGGSHHSGFGGHSSGGGASRRF